MLPCRSSTCPTRREWMPSSTWPRVASTKARQRFVRSSVENLRKLSSKDYKPPSSSNSDLRDKRRKCAQLSCFGFARRCVTIQTRERTAFVLSLEGLGNDGRGVLHCRFATCDNPILACSLLRKTSVRRRFIKGKGKMSRE